MKTMKPRTWVAIFIVCAALLYAMYSWFAPIDVVIPIRSYPPQNAGDLYEKLALWRQQREFNDPAFREGIRVIRDQGDIDQWLHRKMTPEEKEKLKSVIHRFEEIRPLYFQAADQPCVMPNPYNMMMPNRTFMFFLALAQVEEWHMTEAGSQGDHRKLLDNALIVLKISRQISHQGGRINGTDANRLLLRTSKALSVSLPDLSASDSKKLVSLIRHSLSEKAPLREIARHESYVIVGTYQAILREQRRARSFQRPVVDRLWETKQLRWISPRLASREVFSYYQHRGAELDKPLLKQKPPSRPIHPTNIQFVNDFDYLNRRDKLALAQLRLIGCAAAVRAIKLKTGRYPKTLQEAGVQDLNVDPFTGGVFIYKVNPAQGFLLYSVGADGKDNGGERLDDSMHGDVTPILAEWNLDDTLDTSPVWLK